MINKLRNRDKTNNLTNIALSKENYEKLKRLGCTGESFNDVLSRLLDNAMGGMMREENQQCH